MEDTDICDGSLVSETKPCAHQGAGNVAASNNKHTVLKGSVERLSIAGETIFKMLKNLTVSDVHCLA